MGAKEILRKLLGKKNIFLTQSGDHAILYSLELAKTLGKENVFIQDQGGWLTYRNYPKKLKMEKVELKTDYGLLILSELEKLDEKSVLLVNSLPGYCAEQQMKKIAEICSRRKCLLINDSSGTIGTDIAKTGDIIISSFGKDKPVNLNYGGCVAFDDNWNVKEEFDMSRENELVQKLKELPDRLKMYSQINKKIKNDLKEFGIIHRDGKGINVIVKFENDEEKEKIINYCKSNKYEYTVCPRYIRVNENAVSIEVKRL